MRPEKEAYFFMEKDEYFMRRAITLAKKGRGWTNPNPLVGAVIVRDGVILGEGWHHKYGENHAEIEAINEAYANGYQQLREATLYVTLEPCSHYGKTPPCADRICREGFSRVVIAMEDPNPMVCQKGIKKLVEAGISVEIGLLEEESKILNEVYSYGIRTKMSYVHFKTALTLDGKIRTAGKESQWISSEESREEVQQLRSLHTGIMVGVQTVCDDNPRLTSRISGSRQPVRIILDSNLRIPKLSQIVQTAKEYPTIVATTKSKQEYPQWILDAGIQLITVDKKEGKCDLRHLMRETYKRGIDSILLEGGPSVAASALKEQIVQFFTGYYAPLLFGGEFTAGSIGGSGVEKIKDAYRMKDMKLNKVGRDIKIEGGIMYPDVYRNN